MIELSLTTLNIVALSKIILFIFVFLLIFLIYRKKQKPWQYLLLITGTIFIFYLIFCYPLKKMLWGNSGDESFIFAFLRQVLAGYYFHDFYYGWLPNFYPPLYFWITGAVARFFTANGITAAKIGVLGALIVFFLGSYLWQKIFYKNIISVANEPDKSKNSLSESPWFWLLLPVVFFLLIDFDVFILKPYEVVTALFIVIFAGLLNLSFSIKKWPWKYFIFFILSGGFLFLAYYFWWFILLPAFLFLIIFTADRLKNFKRFIIIGFGIFIMASIFLVPLILSFIKNGLENGQAGFFLPGDLSTYVPWSQLSILSSLLFIFGLIGLIKFSQEKLVRTNLFVFITCYLYQFVNFFYFLLKQRTFLAAKSFPILSLACLAVGAVYLIDYGYKFFVKKYGSINKNILIIVILIFIPLLPLIKFIDDPVVRVQIEKDLIQNNNAYLSEIIQKIPYYEEKIWLSGTLGELPAFLPLSYYVAYNQHFSHQAAFFSQRFSLVKKLAASITSEDFQLLIIQESKPTITGLIFYKNNLNFNNYYLYFWEDNFPNGGKDLEIKINKNLISENFWHKEYEDAKFIIFTLK